MKICLYSPYVPKHIGGGEKYFFDVAKTLVGLGHQVYVALTRDLDGKFAVSEVTHDLKQVLDHQQVREKYEEFLDYSLKGVQFIAAPLNTPASFWQKLLWTEQWDVLYYATDGSLFFSLAKKNFLHIQVPFTDHKKSLIDRLKLANWSIKNTNSGFTKKVIETHWQTAVNYIHYPMIESPKVPANLLQKKEKRIIHVGRFFRNLHSKRQDALVDFFRDMCSRYPAETAGWQLVLIGSVEDPDYFAEVEKKAAGLPIQLLQVTRKKLWEEYQRAKIYWHATGFNLDEAKEPAKMEHFGISTVEAMSMGCVPVVIGQGGQVEVVGNDLKELLWKTEEECIQHTLQIMTHEALFLEKARIAQRQAQVFNAERFRETLIKMIR